MSLSPNPRIGPEPSLDGLPDEELVVVARIGGPRSRMAYDVLVARHTAWLHLHLLRLLGGPGRADDVAQEAFLRGWLALDRFGTPARFRPWLRIIATHIALNEHRAQTRRTQHEQSPPLPDAPPSPLDPLQLEDLLRLLDALPPSHRDILVLRYLQELSLIEIGARLGVGPSALKMRLKRARDALLGLLEGTQGPGPISEPGTLLAEEPPETHKPRWSHLAHRRHHLDPGPARSVPPHRSLAA